jgi:hypothetical protein
MPSRRRLSTHPDRAYDVRCAVGRPDRTIAGLVFAATCGTPLTLAGCAQLACISGLRRSVCLASAGRRTPIGTRTEPSPITRPRRTQRDVSASKSATKPGLPFNNQANVVFARDLLYLHPRDCLIRTSIVQRNPHTTFRVHTSGGVPVDIIRADDTASTARQGVGDTAILIAEAAD